MVQVAEGTLIKTVLRLMAEKHGIDDDVVACFAAGMPNEQRGFAEKYPGDMVNIFKFAYRKLVPVEDNIDVATVEVPDEGGIKRVVGEDGMVHEVHNEPVPSRPELKGPIKDYKFLGAVHFEEPEPEDLESDEPQAEEPTTSAPPEEERELYVSDKDKSEEESSGSTKRRQRRRKSRKSA